MVLPRRSLLGVSAEWLLLGLLIFAIGRDVSEAAAKCDTAFDCSAQCANIGSASFELIETTKRFTAGTLSPRCGDYKAYLRPNCAGAPQVAPANCSNCCK